MRSRRSPSGIRPAKVGPVPPRLLPAVIAAPDWLFANLFMKGWRIDAKARSSMADDLAQGRKTEIDQLNGELVRLAEASGIEAPLNRKIVELMRAAEGGAKPWPPAALRHEVLAGKASSPRAPGPGVEAEHRDDEDDQTDRAHQRVSGDERQRRILAGRRDNSGENDAE